MQLNSVDSSVHQIDFEHANECIILYTVQFNKERPTACQLPRKNVCDTQNPPKHQQTFLMLS